MDIRTVCQREQIAAYVDGELDNESRSGLEQHIEGCKDCAAELRAQRLFMCELDAVITGDVHNPVPRDFAQIVAAHAESDMSGVRTRAEQKLALQVCAMLSLAALSLLGVGTTKLIVSDGHPLIAQALGLASFAAKTLYDTAASATVISRVIGKGFIIDTPLAGLFLILLGLAVLLLSRLIATYHRTRATE